MAKKRSSRTHPTPNPNPKRRRPSSLFSTLPSDLLLQISSPFDLPTLLAASSVCLSWFRALRPLREAMLLLRWGKRFKAGDGGVRRDRDKALASFLKGAEKGSAMAMVDAGVVLWEIGRREEATRWYRKAAEFGCAAGMCNLATSIVEAEKPDIKEAVMWFTRAASSGYPRAQYSLALCFQRGQGVNRSPFEAAKWYLRAAEGGNPRAMYNLALCYTLGEGLPTNPQHAEMWLNRAAKCGHQRALYELGIQFSQSGEAIKAVMYLELASRAGGEEEAGPLKDEILLSLSNTSKARALSAADQWIRGFGKPLLRC